MQSHDDDITTCIWLHVTLLTCESHCCSNGVFFPCFLVSELLRHGKLSTGTMLLDIPCSLYLQLYHFVVYICHALQEASPNYVSTLVTAFINSSCYLIAVMSPANLLGISKQVSE